MAVTVAVDAPSRSLARSGSFFRFLLAHGEENRLTTERIVCVQRACFLPESRRREGRATPPRQGGEAWQSGLSSPPLPRRREKNDGGGGDDATGAARESCQEGGLTSEGREEGVLDLVLYHLLMADRA